MIDYTYNPSRLLPWVDGQGYSSDAYAWWIANTGQPTKLYQNGVDTGQQEGAGGINSFRMANAWRVQATSDVKVGIVDTGVRRVGSLANCVIGDDDISGHGTRIASLVVAVAPGTTILSRSTHYGEADMISGMDWCILSGAKVIILAWGEGNSSALLAAVNRCLLADVVLCCSMANNGQADYPALWVTQVPNIIPVASTDKQGKLYASSIIPSGVSAPGRNLPLQDLTEMRYGSGTSYAVGLVAGVIALMRSTCPNLTATQAVDIVKRNLRGLVKQISPEDCLREAVRFRIVPEKLSRVTTLPL